MLFFNRNNKNQAANEFEKLYKNFPESTKIELDKAISIIDYFMFNVETKFFTELKSASNMSCLSPEIEDLIYCTFLLRMDYSNISNPNRLKTLAISIIFNRNNDVATEENQQNLIPLSESEIDKETHISFYQLMTRIYNTWNKEFTKEEESKYEKTYDLYYGIMTVFISGTLNGLNKSSIIDIRSRAKLIRQKYKSSQFIMLKMFGVLGK